jgi:hypothetical protein
VRSGGDLTGLLLERAHRKVGVTNLLVQNLTPNGRGTGGRLVDPVQRGYKSSQRRIAKRAWPPGIILG